MKIANVNLVALLMLGLLPVVSFAQQQPTGAPVTTPNSATITAGPSKGLKVGQEFIGLINLDKAPKGYEGGWIHYRFDRVAQPPPSTEFRRDRDRTGYEGRVAMQDDQSIYKFSVPIDDGMVPGRWKLTSVTFGVATQTQLSILSDATFEVAGREPWIHIQVPPEAHAGHWYSVNVTFDEYPKAALDENCSISITGFVNGGFAPGAIQMGQIVLTPDKHSYEIGVPLAPDVHIGNWSGQVSVQENLPPPPPGAGHHYYDGRCASYPAIVGMFRFNFVVEQALGLVTPTSATVTVNPSQAQLFVGEADRLKAQAEQLQKQFATEDASISRATAMGALKTALDDVAATEEKFKKAGEGPSLPSRIVNAFFDDIRYDYGEDLKLLAAESARNSAPNPQLERVSGTAGKPRAGLSPASKAVLNSMVRTGDAYLLVASSKSMTFDLAVYSDPPGAEISYRGFIDRDFTTVSQPTNSTIENLTIGQYTIRVHKPGFKGEKEYDAVKTRTRSIMIPMEKVREP